MKRAILFVDDEPNVIQGLKRSLRSHSGDFDMFFALSGREALEIMAANPVDVLVTDIRMPGMNGAELLDITRQKYPQVIRFVLSGFTDQEMSLRSSRVAHQFISKPCETGRLIEIIGHSLELRELQSNPALRRITTSITRLPSLPRLYTQLVNELNSPETSLKKVSSIIANDITMTAKTLQLVNSAFYGLPSKVSNLQQAVTILGTNTLKSFVLFEGVFSEYDIGAFRTIDLERLWAHSIGVGNLARHLAGKFGCDTNTMDDTQVAGVMHDLGKLIQLQIPGYYERMNLKVLEGIKPLEAEYTILGTSHSELGAYLLGLWGLPDPIVMAVAYHHLPSWQTDNSLSPLAAVHIANAYYNEKVESNARQPYEFLDKRYLYALKISDRIEDWFEICRNYISTPK